MDRRQETVGQKTVRQKTGEEKRKNQTQRKREFRENRSDAQSQELEKPVKLAQSCALWNSFVQLNGQLV